METIIGTLHATWATTATLLALVPASSVFTGRVPSKTPMPYVSIQSPTGSRDARTNKNNYGNKEIVFHIWTDTESEGSAIREQIKDTFLNSDFSCSDGNVLDVMYENESQEQVSRPNFTAWETVLTVSLKTAKVRGN
jgi:hypothetical protein